MLIVNLFFSILTYYKVMQDNYNFSCKKVLVFNSNFFNIKTNKDILLYRNSNFFKGLIFSLSFLSSFLNTTGLEQEEGNNTEYTQEEEESTEDITLNYTKSSDNNNDDDNYNEDLDDIYIVEEEDDEGNEKLILTVVGVGAAGGLLHTLNKKKNNNNKKSKTETSTMQKNPQSYEKKTEGDNETRDPNMPNKLSHKRKDSISSNGDAQDVNLGTDIRRKSNFDPLKLQASFKCINRVNHSTYSDNNSMRSSNTSNILETDVLDQSQMDAALRELHDQDPSLQQKRYENNQIKIQEVRAKLESQKKR